jgi:hypothetical protein
MPCLSATCHSLAISGCTSASTGGRAYNCEHGPDHDTASDNRHAPSGQCSKSLTKVKRNYLTPLHAVGTWKGDCFLQIVSLTCRGGPCQNSLSEALCVHFNLTDVSANGLDDELVSGVAHDYYLPSTGVLMQLQDGMTSSTHPCSQTTLALRQDQSHVLQTSCVGVAASKRGGLGEPLT